MTAYMETMYKQYGFTRPSMDGEPVRGGRVIMTHLLNPPMRTVSLAVLKRELGLVFSKSNPQV